jgi:hypothetical protein
MIKQEETKMKVLNLVQRYTSQLFKYMPLLTILCTLVILLFTTRCSQIEELEGGPKDTTPPQLISTYPLHESIGFKGQKLRLTFDKEIEIQDIYNRLVITPKLARLEDKPSYVAKVKGKMVELDLETPLEKETTYTFNFKDAICDIKEHTAAVNPTLTFSTGDYVDSMYVAGQVKYLMTGQLANDALVCLYKIIETDTCHILNSTPDYFTKTNQEGEFKLEHIKQGKYRICTGYSKENKLILDASKDPYGFLPTTLELLEPIDSLPLYILQADVTEFKLQNHQPQGQYFEISFSKPITAYTLELANRSRRFKNAQLYSHLIEDGHTIRVYNTLGLLEDDILEAKLTAQDIVGKSIEENISIHFRDKTTKKEKLKYTIQPIPGTKVDPKPLELNIIFNKPIKSIQQDSLFFVINQADTLKLIPDEIILQSHKDTITIQKYFDTADWIQAPQEVNTETDELLNIELHIAKGAFISVEKELNEPSDHKYFIKTPQECGTIKGRISTRFPGFIVQLLDTNYEVVEEIRNKTDYVFKDILPGNYLIRVLLLREKDGKWNFGNINQSIPPDPVIFYPHELAIVANWELDYIDFEL